jgi:hypothetical protein
MIIQIKSKTKRHPDLMFDYNGLGYLEMDIMDEVEKVGVDIGYEDLPDILVRPASSEPWCSIEYRENSSMSYLKSPEGDYKIHPHDKGSGSSLLIQHFSSNG